MADSKLASASSPGRPSSPPPHCPICLGSCSDKSFSNSCMHQFCFKCLLEWSKIKAECPLCKQPFKSIIHNIKSNEEYDEYLVEQTIYIEDNRYIDTSLLLLPNAAPVAHHQYHFRTTFTVDTHGEHAIQQMFSGFRNRNGDTSTNFRRSVYNQNLWVYDLPDLTGRYRDATPFYFRNNPGALTRLVPWLNRELNALLHENTQHIMHLVDIILDHLLRHHICSHVFRTLLRAYLGDKTDHFIHEFYNFMRSPYDMVGYDRHVIYTFILGNESSTPSNPSQTDVIDLVDSDSDEPIFVSEERVTHHSISSSSSTSSGSSSSSSSVSTVSNDNAEDRKPVLPPKLRLKNRRRSRERRKRRHQETIARDLSTSSNSSSSSTSSSREQQRRKLKKKSSYNRKQRRLDETPEISSDSEPPVIEIKTDSSDDENTPLCNYARVSEDPYNNRLKASLSDEECEYDYYKHQNFVKSKICQVKQEDKPGPSNTRKEDNTLCYSKPGLLYDSESSEY